MLASGNSAAESADDPFTVTKLWLIVSGIYIWEFITNLDFEWSVIRGHQRYRWTIWIYSVSRLSGLAVIIFVLVDFYDSSPINCQAWVTSGWAFSSLGGYGLSSMLITLRIFAIWDKNKVIMAISAAVWVVNLGFQLAGKLTSSVPCGPNLNVYDLISGVVKIRAVWVPATRSCRITNIEICRNFSIYLLVTDIILLFIMLTGLLRLRQRSSYLSHLLWKQGVIWLAIASAAELPQVLFLVPSMVAIIIAATRTYRSLVRSASPPDFHLGEPDSSNAQRTKRLASHTKDSSVVHIPSNRLEVTVHRSYHEDPMSPTNHHGSYPRSDAQFTDKPQELGSDDDVEGGDEKK
ncbi:hypothetical protein F5888DRAFT_1803454 [Russula emetica]|nr:hypothetical protein F5888DRAFT_1803454 [Russula emetica]